MRVKIDDRCQQTIIYRDKKTYVGNMSLVFVELFMASNDNTNITSTQNENR